MSAAIRAPLSATGSSRARGPNDPGAEVIAKEDALEVNLVQNS
jgi:hypothetical protein